MNEDIKKMAKLAKQLQIVNQKFFTLLMQLASEGRTPTIEETLWVTQIQLSSNAYTSTVLEEVLRDLGIQS